jgi:hypothetical protein
MANHFCELGLVHFNLQILSYLKRVTTLQRLFLPLLQIFTTRTITQCPLLLPLYFNKLVRRPV